MFLTLKSFAMQQRGGGALLLAAATFAAGLTAGALIAPLGASRDDAVAAIQTREPQPASALRSGHPAEVVRVLDGDTFEARVRIWPGMDVTTRVRLRGIDAPELHARCDDERVKALAAQTDTRGGVHAGPDAHPRLERVAVEHAHHFGRMTAA